MRHRVYRVVVGVLAAVGLVAAAAMPAPVLAQSAETKPADQAPAAAGQQPAKEPQKVDEYAEAAKAVNGPAGNPECYYFGTRVVILLWKDDLDTAFRHLDLYDRFGCPSGHIQATFRCLLLHSAGIDSKADAKAPDTLPGRVQACWLNPTQPATPAAAAPAAAAPAPAAAAPSTTTNR